MNRLLSTMCWDVRLQFRNGFYYVTAFVLAVWILLLSRLPELGPSGPSLVRLLPVLVLGNLVITTFYFLGALVLLEKGEGTLEAQIVTPLRTGEYLASKVITLSALALVENVAIVAVFTRLRFGVLPLTAGIAFGSVLYCLGGFLVVARYDSINEYLFPSILYTAALSLPLLPYFGAGLEWLFFLHPLQGPLYLLQGAFEPVAAWKLLYGLAYSGLWIAAASWLSCRAFLRFVVRREGVK